MAITRSSVHVSVPDMRLLQQLILGAVSLDKGLIEVLTSKHKQVSLNRFFTSKQLIGPRVPTPTTPLDAATKDERQVVMGEIQLYDEFDPKDFDQDWPFLYSQGMSVGSTPATQLRKAVIDSYGPTFNYDLEVAIYQGDTASGNAWTAQFDGIEKQLAADVTVINPAAAGVITAANIISILESVVAACPAEVQELDSPTIVMNHQDKYFYREAARALNFKGDNITEKSPDLFGGFPIVSTHGLSKDKVILANMSGGERSAFKAGTWMDADRNNVAVDPLQANSDEWFVKMTADFGVNHVYGKEIVYYVPA